MGLGRAETVRRSVDADGGSAKPPAQSAIPTLVVRIVLASRYRWLITLKRPETPSPGSGRAPYEFPVVLLFAAANRDSARFPDPNGLLLDRRGNRHLGYGWGTHSFFHVCVGR